MIRCVHGRSVRTNHLVFFALIAFGVTACSGDTLVGGTTLPEIELKVWNSGAGNGTVETPDNLLDLDCSFTGGVSVPRDCTLTFQDAGGGGDFVVRATPDDGNDFLLWTTRTCATEGSGGCRVDCGPDDDNTECQLHFDASAGDVAFKLNARFEWEPKDIHLSVVAESGSGPGSGTVMTPQDGYELDCQIEGSEESGTCVLLLEDYAGAGSFDVVALPDPGNEFAGWTSLSCNSDGIPTYCDFNCGPDDDEAICLLSFGERSGNVDFSMEARFAANLNTVVIEDDFEAVNACDAWSSNVAGNGTFVATDGCEAAGGDPAGYRTMKHEVTDVGNVVISHWFSGETYDPSVEGAIERIDYSEDHIITQPAFVGGAVGIGFRLEQGGTWYTYTIGGFDDTQWASYAVSLTPADFVPAPGPDFSISGGEIQFGYVRSNSNTTDGATSTSVHGIDNWQVVIVQAP